MKRKGIMAIMLSIGVITAANFTCYASASTDVVTEIASVYDVNVSADVTEDFLKNEEVTDVACFYTKAPFLLII